MDESWRWWFNLDEMVDDFIIIVRCFVVWISKICALSMIFKYYVLYAYDGVCLCFNY